MKKQAYIKRRKTQITRECKKYKRNRNDTSWKHKELALSLESDFYDVQKQMWRLIIHQRKKVEEHIKGIYKEEMSPRAASNHKHENGTKKIYLEEPFDGKQLEYVI